MRALKLAEPSFPAGLIDLARTYDNSFVKEAAQSLRTSGGS